MALMTNYRPLYGDLTDADMTKVGQFSARVLTAKADNDIATIRSMIKEAVAIVSEGGEDSLDRLFGTLHYVERYGQPDEKEAVAALLPLVKEAADELIKEAKFSPSEKWQLGLGAGSLALSAAPLIGYAASRMGRSGKIKKSLKQIMQDHPELRNDPNVPRYFQAIVDFAPAVAANAMVAGNVLMQMHRLGPSAVTPKTIAELLDIQGSVGKQPGLSDHLSRVNPSGLSTAIGGMYANRQRQQERASDRLYGESREQAKHEREMQKMKLKDSMRAADREEDRINRQSGR